MIKQMEVARGSRRAERRAGIIANKFAAQKACVPYVSAEFVAEWEASQKRMADRIHSARTTVATQTYKQLRYMA